MICFFLLLWRHLKRVLFLFGFFSVFRHHEMALVVVVISTSSPASNSPFFFSWFLFTYSLLLRFLLSTMPMCFRLLPSSTMLIVIVGGQVFAFCFFLIVLIVIARVWCLLHHHWCSGSFIALAIPFYAFCCKEKLMQVLVFFRAPIAIHHFFIPCNYFILIFLIWIFLFLFVLLAFAMCFVGEIGGKYMHVDEEGGSWNIEKYMAYYISQRIYFMIGYPAL